MIACDGESTARPNPLLDEFGLLPLAIRYLERAKNALIPSTSSLRAIAFADSALYSDGNKIRSQKNIIEETERYNLRTFLF